MSRLTKYLKQSARFERALREEDGTASLNPYGEALYEEAISVRCRREPFVDRQSSIGGSFVGYGHTYYLDESVVPYVGDRLDGHLIQQVDEYVDGSGTLVGYEVRLQ